MKRILTLLFLSLTALLYSQWEILNPKPDGNDLNDLKFVTNLIGYAVGYDGKIIKTTDGGETWFKQESNTFHNLKSVCFIDINTGWALGNIVSGYDVLLKTTNGGINWTSKKLSGKQYVLNTLYFRDNNNGWMAGKDQFVYKTTNGGYSWTAYSTGLSAYTDPISCIYFKDENNGWATCQSGKYISTTNGGLNWSIYTSDSVSLLNKIQFLSGNVGWMIGSHLLKTTNGGTTWSKISLLNNANSACFSTENTGIAVGNSGVIQKTTDGGINWVKVNTTNIEYYSQPMISVVNLNVSDFVITGGAGIILKSTNSGETWSLKTNCFYYDLRSVSFADLNIGWVTGVNGMVYKTTNGGNSWLKQNTGSSSQNNYIKALNENTVFICGAYGIILKTTNGGNNWIKQTISTISHLNEIAVIDENNQWVVGSNGAIFKTTNGGTSWIKVTTTYTNDYNACYFCDVNTGYIAGTGVLIKTTNGGISWNNITPSGASYIQSVYFPSFKTGFAVENGAIYKTYDAGNTWIKTLASLVPSKVIFCDTLCGYIIANPYRILKTTNGGNSWLLQYPGSEYKWLRGICVIDENNAWVAGSSGFISRTTNGGTPIINLSLWIADNANITKIAEKIIYEDEKYIIPPKKLDPPFSKYQTIYNGIDSSIFYIEGGALSKSITLRIIMSIPGGDSLYGLIGGKKVWFYGVFEVDGAVGDFYFHEPKLAILKIPKHKDFYTMTSLIGFNSGSNWYFGYYNNTEAKWDSVGIVSQNLTDTVVAKISHFSEIGAGDESLITGVKEKEAGIIPAVFSLAQNYPNPFNPLTKIKYSIPQTQNKEDLRVTLKIYDILGREITTLINETKHPGNYTTEFNGSRYPSGIYFYELKAGEYREVKKMILIK